MYKNDWVQYSEHTTRAESSSTPTYLTFYSEVGPADFAGQDFVDDDCCLDFDSEELHQALLSNEEPNVVCFGLLFHPNIFAQIYAYQVLHVMLTQSQNWLVQNQVQSKYILPVIVRSRHDRH